MQPRLFKSETGAVIAEFAMMLPVFCLLAFGFIDIQWLMRDGAALEYIVTEAARCEAIGALACPNQAKTGEYAAMLAANVHLPIAKEQITVFACTAQTCSVSITFPFKPLGPWFPKVEITRTGEAAVPPPA
jgi:Flp pilus assembly protein TadG